MKNHVLDYLFRLADSSLILGQRLSEWCGHGPILEQDIAMTNIALDLIGQSRILYQYASEVQGEGKTEDDLAFLRDTHEFRNFLLVEQPIGDFAYTIARQFMYDAYNQLNYEALVQSKNESIAAIAAKSLKEVNYHLRWSSEWVIRLGDGTAVSHEKIQTAIQELWTYTGELFTPTETDKKLAELGIAPDLELLKTRWHEKVTAVFEEATLEKPKNEWMQLGGKTGKHTENLGYILAEMQFLQRAYPQQTW